MPQLSVIIVSYNVKYFVHQCLCSVERAAQGLDVEVFVVDNNSTDGTSDYLPPLHPQVHYIWNKENVGFARANNQAIRKSSGLYILLLNPDTIISERTLHDCLEQMCTRPDAGAIGVRMLNADGSFAPESRRGVPTPFTAFCKMSGLCKLFPRSRTFGRYYMQYLDAHHVNEIEVISGAFMFLRRSTLKQSGSLDEDFFMYGEDIDLSFRILQTGLKNLYLPTPIIHYKGESTHDSTYRYVRIFYEAMLIFFRKHFSHYNLLISLPIKLAIFCRGAMTYLKLKFQHTTSVSERDILRYMQLFSYTYATTDDAEGYSSVCTLLAEHDIKFSTEHKVGILVFNAEKTPYSEMLNRLENQDAPRRQWLATYYPSQHLLITPFYIFR